MAQNPPLTDSAIVALSRLIDDSQLVEKREPTHYDLEVLFEQTGIKRGDNPSPGGKPVGKAKRVRAALNWALANNPSGGDAFLAALISTVKGHGGFRPQSSNYCGVDAIENLRAAISGHGWELSLDGHLAPLVLESLSGRRLTEALRSYADRARRGALDNPLVTGTAKDLLEATAAHVLVEKWGGYPTQSNFPTLLGQAFTALGLATPTDPVLPGEPACRRMERAAYELAASLNALRNKQGTGHGRPWVSTVTDSQAKFAIESMGNIASLMLDSL
jgi:hypothetical protein